MMPPSVHSEIEKRCYDFEATVRTAGARADATSGARRFAKRGFAATGSAPSSP
jgi:hypothetical protein